MKVQIIRNYISVAGGMAGPGEIIELEDGVAKRFLTSGQVMKVNGLEAKATVPDKETVEKKTAESKEPAAKQTLPVPNPEVVPANAKK